MDIENVNVNELIEPKWNATHILRPDLLVLAESIGQYGLLSPLLVQKSGRLVIDGTQRLRLIIGNKHLMSLTGGVVPVIWVDVDEIDAMIERTEWLLENRVFPAPESRYQYPWPLL